jgi:hypothetical protein
MWKHQLSNRDAMTFEKVAAELLSRYGYETFTQKPVVDFTVCREIESIPQFYTAREPEIFAEQ